MDVGFWNSFQVHFEVHVQRHPTARSLLLLQGLEKAFVFGGQGGGQVDSQLDSSDLKSAKEACCVSFSA